MVKLKVIVKCDCCGKESETLTDSVQDYYASMGTENFPPGWARASIETQDNASAKAAAKKANPHVEYNYSVAQSFVWCGECLMAKLVAGKSS